MPNVKLKQSRSWWIQKDLKWIIDNSIFVYITTNRKYRLFIVTNKEINGSDCFGLEVDGNGIAINSHSIYSGFYEDIYKYTSENINEFIISFFTEQEKKYVNPSNCLNYIKNVFNKKKDIIININQ